MLKILNIKRQNLGNLESRNVMIIEYEEKYAEEVKDLFVELQEHIVNIDKEQYNIIAPQYREIYFAKTLDEVKKYEGKIFLYEKNNHIVGLIAGMINNDALDTYDFKAPKRGRISELIVSKNCRSEGIGKKLLKAMEEHLKAFGCQDILIGVFGYNERAIQFYEKMGYHTRMIEVTKKI